MNINTKLCVGLLPCKYPKSTGTCKIVGIQTDPCSNYTSAALEKTMQKNRERAIHKKNFVHIQSSIFKLWSGANYYISSIRHHGYYIFPLFAFVWLQFDRCLFIWKVCRYKQWLVKVHTQPSSQSSHMFCSSVCAQYNTKSGRAAKNWEESPNKHLVYSIADKYKKKTFFSCLT